MYQEDDLYTIYSSVIVASIFCSVGFTANLFIAIFNCKNWMKSHRVVSSDKILFSLVVARLLMPALFIFYLICLFTSSALLKLVNGSSFFMVFLLFMDTCSLWFVTLLNTLYCVKISNFHHSVFILMKQNFSPKIPWLMLAVVLISAFSTLPYIVLIPAATFPVLVPEKNGTDFGFKENSLLLLIPYVLSFSLQFIMNVMSASLLIDSLRRHIQKMQRNITGFWNPQTEAHVGAMKLMIYFLILYIPHMAFTLFLYLPYYFSMNLGTRFICMAISTVYHPGHSVLIILTQPKLKTKAKQILCFYNRIFRDQ
ncbi:taste receptor type 2 member 4-like [Suncus etruscus]|uniref:taste receptor type 2 member 4-like n=1 Tax=Suncus etruscus TaxID=109475 RepID=UPI00210FDB24|nr:taste receptor type 2 member 4-like [Suncus etruscus]